jgi:phage tail sheath gpL-like
MKRILLAAVLLALCISLGAGQVFAASANISFDQVPSGIKKPGIYMEQDLSLASRALPSMARKVLIIGQRTGARVEPAIYQAGTLDDMVSAGTYTGTAARRYRVKISATGTPDQMQWSTDNGATWSVASNVTTTATTLSSGVTVSWAASTGHALNDEWRFAVYPAGTTAQAVPTQVFSDNAASASFGVGSLAHLMVRAAMQRNPYIDLTVTALTDAAGVAASGTVTITDAATGSGSLRLYIGDQYVDVAIVSGATATTVARDISNAVSAKSDLPVYADMAAGVVTLTAKNKGLAGNEIGLGYDLTPGITTAAVIVPMASGATNPTLQTALDSVFSTRYHLIATPYNNAADLATLKTHIETVANALEQRGAVGVYATTGTLAAATTLAGQVNSQRIAAAFVRYAAGTTQKQTPSWKLAAITAAGIAADPDVSNPIKNLAMTYTATPAISDRLSRTEQESALTGGVSPIEVGPGESPRLVRMPVTYTLDQNSQAVFLDVHKIFGMDYVRDAALADISAKAPKKIIREGGTTTVSILRNIVLDVAYRCQQAGVLTGVSSYTEQFIVEEDLQNVGQINILMPSPVVDGLYVVAVKQILF